MSIKPLPPSRPSVGKQHIDMIRRLANLRDEALELVDAGAVGGDGVGLGAGSFVGEGVEGLDGFVAGLRFSGCDVDFGAAGLEEAGIGFC